MKKLLSLILAVLTIAAAFAFVIPASAEEKLMDAEYEIGTIKTASGQNDENAKRFRITSYITISDLEKITIGSDYCLIWFAYDKDYTYLGNGTNEYPTLPSKGVWLEAGKGVTCTEILEWNANSVYMRFAVKKSDESKLTETDFEQSLVKVYLSANAGNDNESNDDLINIECEIGTIASENGQDKSNNKRIRVKDYIAVADIESISISDKYNLTWFAYDKDKNYLGNASGKWLEAGTGVTQEEILNYYSDVVYIRFAVKNLDGTTLSLAADVAASQIKVHKASAPENTEPVTPPNPPTSDNGIAFVLIVAVAAISAIGSAAVLAVVKKENN